AHPRSDTVRGGRRSLAARRRRMRLPRRGHRRWQPRAAPGATRCRRAGLSTPWAATTLALAFFRAATRSRRLAFFLRGQVPAGPDDDRDVAASAAAAGGDASTLTPDGVSAPLSASTRAPRHVRGMRRSSLL